MLIMNKKHLMILPLMLLLTQLCCKSINKSPETINQLSELEIVELIQKLPPWRSSRLMTTKEWCQYVTAGQLLQRSDRDVFVSALRLITDTWRHTSWSGDYIEESKPFLLLRVMFDLPNEVSHNSRFASYGWTGRETEDKWHPNWPIYWGDDGPRLVTVCHGAMGPPYAVVREYVHISSNYPFRDLSKVEKQLYSRECHNDETSHSK